MTASPAPTLPTILLLTHVSSCHPKKTLHSPWKEGQHEKAAFQSLTRARSTFVVEDQEPEMPSGPHEQSHCTPRRGVARGVTEVMSADMTRNQLVFRCALFNTVARELHFRQFQPSSCPNSLFHRPHSRPARQFDI